MGRTAAYLVHRNSGCTRTVSPLIHRIAQSRLLTESNSDFLSRLKIPEWLSLTSLFPCIFLITSWIFLDPDKSHRHYLSVGLVVCLIFLQLALVTPLAARPKMCYDMITPRDMHSSMSCAWSGAFFQVGGIGATVWIALRSLWLHIRICWDRSPGATFLYFSLVLGILIPIVLLVTATLVSGYSFRIGSTCVINHNHAFGVFWGWLLAFAGFAFFMQWITTAYCGGVYFRSARQHKACQAHQLMSSANQTLDRSAPKTSGRQMSNPASSARVRHNGIRWRRIRSLFFSQWRNFAISILVVLESVFFVVVFWSQDKKLQNATTHPELQPDIATWSICLTSNRGNKAPCLDLVKPFIISPAEALASLVMAALIGLEVSLILIRWSIFTEWVAVFKRLKGHSIQDGLEFNAPSPLSDRNVEDEVLSRHRFCRIPFFCSKLSGYLFQSLSRPRRRGESDSGSHAMSYEYPSRKNTSGRLQGKDSWSWNVRKDSVTPSAPREGDEALQPQPVTRGKTSMDNPIHNPHNRVSSPGPGTQEEIVGIMKRSDANYKDSNVLDGSPDASILSKKEEQSLQQGDNPAIEFGRQKHPEMLGINFG